LYWKSGEHAYDRAAVRPLERLHDSHPPEMDPEEDEPDDEQGQRTTA